ncbi:cold shock domain protein CspD [compost metagenome]|uniref:Cold shock protein (Beta-ribbon, CspA family) n=1 Tax=Pseudomonas linyingensis TaxID=915471 RepID=A0A1H7B1E5_9PSED|nr:cold shock protein (beta-ribbon, CspA family) [Pseudomonas linyingensis]
MSGRNRLCLLVTKVKSLSILKTVHLLSGAAALLLSIVPSLRADALPWLQQPDSLYLAFTGLANLLVAPLVAGARQRLQGAASTLLVLAVVLQSLALMVPLSSIGGQPAELFTLLAVALAALMQLIPQPSAAPAAAAPATQQTAPSRPSTAPSPSAKAPAAKATATRRSEPDSERETGTVKWFNTSKGFGFISRDRGEDIFVHFRAIRGEGHRVLVEGQRVEFSVVQRDKGLQAEDVTIID